MKNQAIITQKSKYMNRTGEIDFPLKIDLKKKKRNYHFADLKLRWSIALHKKPTQEFRSLSSLIP